MQSVTVFQCFKGERALSQPSKSKKVYPELEGTSILVLIFSKCYVFRSKAKTQQGGPFADRLGLLLW